MLLQGNDHHQQPQRDISRAAGNDGPRHLLSLFMRTLPAAIKLSTLIDTAIGITTSVFFNSLAFRETSQQGPHVRSYTSTLCNTAGLASEKG